jgi:alkaline phosphatase D
MSPQLSRRNVLRAAGALAVGGALAGGIPRYALADERPEFVHGIASGDPEPDRVVIWTRVTPNADSTPGSGLGPAVTVEWEVARDRDFEHVVARGTRDTYPAVDHTVKVDVTGLDPDTHYVYRFHLDGAYSPVGHTRTAPAHSAALDHLRLGVVSCSNWQGGYFSAYRYLAERGDLDAVLHLGDYFYEYGSKEFPKGYDVRVHAPSHEALTLADYRRRHAQYTSDSDLRALHARCPWICMWDDHEVSSPRCAPSWGYRPTAWCCSPTSGTATPPTGGACWRRSSGSGCRTYCSSPGTSTPSGPTTSRSTPAATR